MRIAAWLSCVATVAGHASMVQPPPRNAVDKDLAPWKYDAPASWDHHVDSYICPVAKGNGTIDALSLRNGQSCFYFSHGCTIHCDRCDGKTARFGSTCGNEKTAKATICAAEHRTLNRKAACGSTDDRYYFSPWRAPGSAPVFDACGMAGGSPWAIGKPGWAPGGPSAAGVRYQNTTHAKQGDLGSNLPAAPSGVSWSAGSLVEVSWTMRTNHGGGYQWRIASAKGPLTEEAFQKTVLEPEGMSSLRWGGKRGKQLFFNATRISYGTVPANSTWTMNPLPRADATKYPDAMDAFPAVCYDPNAPADGSGADGLCSGWYGPDNLEVVDSVRVPRSLEAGDYVVQWRWDCEESSQIWMNCADVTVKAA